MSYLCVCDVMARCPAKMAGLIDMPFGMWGRVGHSNHVLDGGLGPTGERAIVGWGRGHPIVKYRDNGA